MGDIEKQGTGWLTTIISGSKYLAPYIWDNDKTPSWDGNIFVYDQEEWTKENLLGKIPVQVKCTQVKDFSGESTKYSFEVVDLRKYLQDGGIMLFVVEVNSINEKKIYYQDLYPSDLKEILGEIKKPKQKTRKIQLKELDISSLAFLETVCKNFLLHRKKQISVIDEILSFHNALDVSGYLVTGENFEEFIFSRKHPLYGKSHQGGVEVVIGNGFIDTWRRPVQGITSIKGENYYDNYEIVRDRNGRAVKLGNKVLIYIDEQKMHYELVGSLDEQIRDITFLLRLIEVKEVTFGTAADGGLNITSIDGETNIQQNLRNRLKVLRDIKALLNYFQVDPNKLHFEKISSEEDSILKILTERFVYNRKIDPVPFKPGFHAIEIGDISLGVFVRSENEVNKYSIYNLFDLADLINFSITNNGLPPLNVSPYVLLKEKLLVSVDNLNTEMIMDSIKAVEFDDKGAYAHIIILFGLELIKAYDSSNRDEFLEAATNLFEWLNWLNESPPIPEVNILQIRKRKGKLTKEEKSALVEIREKAKEDERFDLACGVSILLENKTDVEDYYNKLQDKQKEEFDSFPIYTLAIQLGLIAYTNT